MSHRCVDIEQLGVVAELPADSAERRAIDACPTCRAMLKSYMAFIEAEPAAGSRPADAERQLGEFLDARIAETTSSEPREVRTTPRRSWWATPSWWRLAPVAAAIALVIAVGVWAPWQSAGPPIERGEDDGTALQLQPVQVGDGAVTFAWSPHPEATAYRVVLYRVDLSEITQVDASDTHVSLDIDALPERVGEQVVWRVFALLEGDEIARSAPGFFELH